MRDRRVRRWSPRLHGDDRRRRHPGAPRPGGLPDPVQRDARRLRPSPDHPRRARGARRLSIPCGESRLREDDGTPCRRIWSVAPSSRPCREPSGAGSTPTARSPSRASRSASRTTSGVLDKYFEVTAFRPAPGEFACIFQDVTERKRAEEALRLSERELLRTQRMAGLGSWKWDSATDEVEWTETLYDLFGLDPASPPPTLAEQRRDLRARELRGAHGRRRRDHRDGRALRDGGGDRSRRDGERRWLVGSRRAGHGRRGSPDGTLWGATQDITERRARGGGATQPRVPTRPGPPTGGGRDARRRDRPRLQQHADRHPRPHRAASWRRRGPDHPAHEGLDEIRRAAEHSADLTHQLLAFARSQPATPRVDRPQRGGRRRF